MIERRTINRIVAMPPGRKRETLVASSIRWLSEARDNYPHFGIQWGALQQSIERDIRALEAVGR